MGAPIVPERVPMNIDFYQGFVCVMLVLIWIRMGRAL